MRRNFGRLFSLILVLVVPISPAIASADSISVSQIITVTATVAPARSIVVNDKGQMIKIYSNTDQNVTPTVYLRTAPGSVRPLTAELLKQYNVLMAKPGNKVGVAIDVPQPNQPRLDRRLSALLSTTISSGNGSNIFNW